MKMPAVMAGGVWLISAIGLGAQGYTPQENRSLSDTLMGLQETGLSLQGAATENAELTRRLKNAETTLQSLTQSLAAANSEAEFFRQQTFELKLRMEALGLDSIGTDETRLEQRLLRAVRDLQIVTEERELLADQMIRLSEALLRYLKTAETTDFESRLEVEEQLRRTGETLGLVPETAALVQGEPAALTEAMVISFKQELGLVVLNVGRKHGVKLGMPFQISRGENTLASVRVINVRETISGAIVENINEARQPFKVGDRVRVITQF